MRRRLALLALLVLTAGLAALVTQRGGRDADLVRGAPDRLHDAAPFRLHLRLSLVAEDGAIRSVESEATVDERGLAHVELADVVGPGDLEVVADGTTTFLSVPEARQDDVGARWLRFESPSIEAARGAGIGELPDPLSVLRALKEADEITDAVARDELRFHELVANVEGGPLAPLGPRLTGQVWLDEDHLPRRLRLSADLGGRGTVVALLDVLDVGAPVEIGVPGGDAVRDVEGIATALALVTA